MKTIFRNFLVITFAVMIISSIPGCKNPSGGNDPTVPGVVFNFTAEQGNEEVTVSWEAPLNNGGSVIVRYEVTMDDWETTIAKEPAEFSHNFTGLTNYIEYTFKARAVNAVGHGEESTATAIPVPLDGSGEGTEDSPFIVGSEASLRRIGDDWDSGSVYLLTVNITLAPPADGESNWMPIDYFYGTFDGNGNSISGIIINEPDDFNLGMFREISYGGFVKNLTLTGININGSSNVGAVTGRNNGTVENISASGSIAGVSTVGGLIGYNENELLSSIFTGTVTGEQDFIGGLAGVNVYGRIENSYSAGSVTGAWSVGGLAGQNGALIQNCYSTSSISGEDYIGGLVGYSYGDIFNSFALSPSITRTGEDFDTFGRVSGTNDGFMSGCFGFADMQMPDDIDVNSDEFDKHGGDISVGDAKSREFWESRAYFEFDGDPWVWNTDRMPSLSGAGTAQAWPPYLNE